VNVRVCVGVWVGVWVDGWVSAGGGEWCGGVGWEGWGGGRC